MPKEFKLPTPPKALSRLPFESQMDKVMEKVNRAIREAPPTKALQKVHDRMPKLPSAEIPSPLGPIKLPAVTPLPEPTPPQIGEREKNIIKASIGMDVASIPGYLVPMVGDYIEEELGDAYLKRMRELMTPEEFSLFQRYDVANPLDVIASLRALTHAQRKKKAR